MRPQKLVFLTLALLASLLLTSCEIFDEGTDTFTRTKQVQESLNNAGFRVGGITQSQPSVCLLSDSREGYFQEFTFSVFTPPRLESIAATVTEQAMRDAGITVTTSPPGSVIAVAGFYDYETYSLAVATPENSVFTSVTPCK